MDTFKSFESKLYTVNEDTFGDIALELFRFQAIHNPTYNAYLQHLAVDHREVRSPEEIPFLPIALFKHTVLKTGAWTGGITFTSSGTSAQVPSQHQLPNLNFYLRNTELCFEHAFGPVKDYNFLALLPSYMERQGSSLIAMMEHFVTQSESRYSGFYLYDIDKLLQDLDALRNDDRKTILWGVSFALLDMAEHHPLDLSKFLIFETGGMKGRRKEITRAALHETLSKAFHVDKIFSEYGMTELLSQAYTNGGARFRCPPWMSVIARDLTDPFQKGLLNETGGINVIDLANTHSIAFIETEDLGKVYPDGTFEIMGRADNSDVRGCNLLLD